VRPHEPQFVALSYTSVQVPEQHAGDVPPQTLPQVVQLFGSDVRSAQVPSQSVRPAGHSQLDATQILPPVQALPHALQWPESVARSTQGPPQQTRGALQTTGRTVAQAPAVQTSTPVHGSPSSQWSEIVHSAQRSDRGSQ
jgi:hypothetical protein